MVQWKMKQLLIIGILLVLLSHTALAQDFCQEKFIAEQSCFLITPTLGSCTSNTYTILNISGSVETGNLTLIDEDIYYLTFNQTQGDYIVSLCDGTTREIYVQGVDDDVSLAILGGLIVLIWILITWANNIRGDANTFATAAKVGLGCFAWAFGFLGLNVGRELAIQNGASDQIVNILTGAYTIGIVLTILIAASLILWVLYTVVKRFYDAKRLL